MRTRVVNLRREPYEVYIGRPGHGQDGYFGNPFRVSASGRQRALEQYREYFYARLNRDEEFRRRVSGLKGKVLGCFCKPEPCHGDVIVEYLEGKEGDLGDMAGPHKEEPCERRTL